MALHLNQQNLRIGMTIEFMWTSDDNVSTYSAINLMSQKILPRSLVLVPDRQSDPKYDKITSARSAKIAKHQLRIKSGSCRKYDEL